MKNKSSLVRFDWAIKRLLRQKSNFVVLEGLLSTLLGENVIIVRILESEGNKEDSEDKFNRIDVLAENSKGELVIVEVQNNRELDYFHRMLYGTSKAVTEYIHEGEKYGTIKKIYSVNIIYFDLGQGKDYVYHGKTQFKGIHFDDILKLSTRQREQFVKQEAGDIFPEYYVLRVNEFDELAKTPLDEWIYFLKTTMFDFFFKKYCIYLYFVILYPHNEWIHKESEMDKKERIEKQIGTLKGIREMLDMNRTEFSRYMDIPLRTLEEWEAGRRQMPEYVLRLIAYYVKVQKLMKEKGIELEERYEQK